MADPKRLYGLNALVLNAGGGIGEAVARTLVKHGANVVAVDSPNSGVDQLFQRVKGITGVAAKFADVDQLPTIIETAAERSDGIDIVVLEFPLRQDGPFESANEALEKLLKMRALLTMAACRAALPHLRKSPSGRIINMGMLRSCFAANGAEAQARAEQDLANLTRALAAETGEDGITANYIQPGAVMTPASRDVFRKNTALRDHCIQGSAQRRLGDPVDIAKVALFLASDDAVFVNGTGVAVDGGRLVN